MHTKIRPTWDDARLRAERSQLHGWGLVAHNLSKYAQMQAAKAS